MRPSSDFKLSEISLGADAVVEQAAVRERGWGGAIPGFGTAWAPLSLRRNFSWTLAGNVVYAGCQWAMLVILAKLGNPEMVGRFALGLAVTAPVFLLANLHLRGILATDVRQEFQFGHYLGLRLATTAVALLVVAGVVLGVGYAGEAALLVGVLATAKACEAISDVSHGLFQRHERMDYIAVSLILRGSLALMAFSAVVVLTGSVVWGAVGLTAAWALVLAAFDLPCAARLSAWEERALAAGRSAGSPAWQALTPVWAPQVLLPLARLALPLGIVMMMVSLNTNVPRYFIERELSEGALGIFAAMGYVIIAGNTIIDALAQSASPRLAGHYARGDVDSFRRLLGGLIGIALLGGVTAVLAVAIGGGRVLTLLYSAEYARHTDVFLWLSVSAGIGFVASIFGYGMTAVRALSIQAPLFAGVALVTTLACAAFIPAHGLLGAAFAMMAGSVCALVGGGVIVARALRRNPGPGKLEE
jgi:O-antigen/teichoic acid export membrane protein